MNTKGERAAPSASEKPRQSARFFCLLAAALILLSFCPLSAAAGFLPVMSSDTIDYYVGYGEPELSASLRGNNEFDKGKSAAIQISIANKGKLEKLTYREYIVPANLSFESIEIFEDYDLVNNTPVTISRKVVYLEDYLVYSQAYGNMTMQKSLAEAEMRIEAGRTTATSLNVKFDCGSPYIEIGTGGDYTFIESIVSGSYTVASVPISVSPNTPAGEYLINVTVDYQYPSNAKMIRSGTTTDGGFTTFLYSDSYIQEYESRHVVMQVPIYVSSGAVFEATEINGTISAGKTKTVSVTYTNVGDEKAYNAECKLSLMYPLSSANHKALLGDLAPGESVTVDFPVKSHSSAMAKVYGVNSDIRYYDKDDRLKIAPSIKLDVEMINPFTIFTFKNALFGVLFLVALSLVYDYSKSRKKKGGGEENGPGQETQMTESEHEIKK
ncbi:MAG: hypothetical protein FWE78_02855 [Methanimicrococcus sp.]|nr:hypothetical protein [Methanimicrococcus sp.]